MTAYIRSKSFKNENACQGKIILNILIIIAIGILSFGYIFQVNGVVEQGYEIRALKDKIQEVQTASQKLQIEAARLQFPANLEEVATDLQMVPVGQAAYLKPAGEMAVKP